MAKQPKTSTPTTSDIRKSILLFLAVRFKEALALARKPAPNSQEDWQLRRAWDQAQRYPGLVSKNTIQRAVTRALCDKFPKDTEGKFSYPNRISRVLGELSTGDFVYRGSESSYYADTKIVAFIDERAEADKKEKEKSQLANDLRALGGGIDEAYTRIDKGLKSLRKQAQALKRKGDVRGMVVFLNKNRRVL